ncbi:MAG: hypothetical protein MI922_26840 [Bacteroidales bacterium]|nr:hypothetical protein [Bacteroidales bacterium]
MKSIFKTIPILVSALVLTNCMPPQPDKKKTVTEKHNYIVLLDLSDRLIIQNDQPERDKELVSFLYDQFAERVRKNLYIRSRDEFKVVIAPQRGSRIAYDEYEDRLYINMDNIPNMLRRKKEHERDSAFKSDLTTLYKKAVFSKNPKDYHGADIWKYIYEDLETDLVKDTLSKNYLFVVTDGYPVVGNETNKLLPVAKDFSDLTVILIEAAPRDKDLEWDRIVELWKEWFDQMKVTDYHFIKRNAISKEKDMIKDLIGTQK